MFDLYLPVPTSEILPGHPPVGPPPLSKAPGPPPGERCSSSCVESTSSPVVESEALMEDVLGPLEQALKDCHGHTRVSLAFRGWGELPSIACEQRLLLTSAEPDMVFPEK